MIKSLKKALKWGLIRTEITDSKTKQPPLLLSFITGILEDILLWNSMWLSLAFIFGLNIIFLISIHQQIRFLEFIFSFCATILIIDAFETWLKCKHRVNCLKRLANHDGTKLKKAANQLNDWMKKKWLAFIFLRETNHTKAFLLVNIILSVIFIIGKYVNGYILIYIACMFLCVFKKLTRPLLRFVKNLQQNVESDAELEGLIPEVSEVDIQLLSFESEQNQFNDEKQSLDYWKPEDLPIEEVSDSSENSSSIITNLSMEKMQSLEKDIDTSDSSEDEYIPLVQQKEQLQSTLEVVQPSSTWSSATYNILRNFSSAVANIMYTTQEDNKKERSSIGSSDGFEMIDKNDLI